MKKGKPILLAAAAGAAVYAGVNALLFFEIFHRRATIPTKIFHKTHPPKKADGDASAPDAQADWLREQQFEEVTLQNADGHALRAFLLPADVESSRYALCAHGYRSNGKREFRFITKYYHDLGFHVLLVDHRASGESEGSLITFGKKESEDLLLWLDWLRERNPAAQIVLHGVSMGAASVLMLSDCPQLLPQVRFIVSDCAYTDITELFRTVLQRSNIPSRIWIAGVDALNRMISGFSLREAQPIAHVQNACVPILFIHGAADDFVPPEMGQANYDACSAQKDLLLVPGAGHSESYPTDPNAYAEKIDAFVLQYMDGAAARS